MPGRPIALTDHQRGEIETLAALLNQQQIADYLGISRRCFQSMLARDPDIEARYKRGKAKAIAHVAQTRNFEPGTIIGLGTVSNEAADDDWSIGCGCIGEYRALETIKTGSAKLDFMQPGDRLRLSYLNRSGEAVMGSIDQTVSGEG